MATCSRCGLIFQDGTPICPHCGLPVQDQPPTQSTNVPPQGQYGSPTGSPSPTFPPGTSSPLNMSAVSILCFLLGFFGIHRFYMGKIITGILMILTLGGLGLWSFIDLTLAMSGRFHDKNGLPINVSRPINTALKIIPIILLSLVYFCLIALLVVLYGDYRFRSMDNAAQTAYQNVVKAEDAYYFRYHKYTNDWGELRNSMGLTMDNYVEYRDLIMRVDSSGCPCYEFKVKHRFLTYGYKYSSCPSVRQRVTIDYF